MAVKLPLAAQDIDQQGLAAAAGFAVGAVVSTHNGFNTGFLDQCAESGEVSFPHILLGSDGIEMMAVAFGAGVNGKVLGAGSGLQVVGIFALHALNKAHAQAAGQERVLTVSFMAAAPAGITEDVDVGSPDGQAFVDIAVVMAAAEVVLAAGFHADYIADFLHHVFVKSSCHTNGLREHGSGTSAAHTVDTLAPPVVSGDAQALNGGGPAQHLADLFVQGHFANELFGALAVLCLYCRILLSHSLLLLNCLVVCRYAL